MYSGSKEKILWKLNGHYIAFCLKSKDIYIWMLNAYGYEYAKVQIFRDNGTRKVNVKILICIIYIMKLIFFFFLAFNN